MLRIIAVLLIVVSSVASAQGIKSPYVPPPFIPVDPTVPGPGVVAGSIRLGGLRLGAYSSFASPYYYQGYGVPYGNGFGYGYGVPFYNLPAPILPPPPLSNLVPGSAISKDIAEAEFTAKLELIFPAPAEVWMDDIRMMDSDPTDISLASPPLKIGASHTFKIRATWSVEGTKYRVERSVTVKVGERSRLTIISGDVVK